MEEKSHKCEICSFGCSSNQQLETHVNNVHDKRRDFKCKHCDKAYLIRNHLNVHVRIEHEELPHLCDVCNKSFTTKEGVKKHYFSVHEDKVTKCNICDKTFSKVHTYLNHRNVHRKRTNSKVFQCKVCEKMFRSDDHLKIHEKRQHENEEITCSDCGKSFSLQYFQDHVRNVHQKLKSYKCHLCQNSFSQKSNLNSHVKLFHLGIKPHKCSICPSSFGGSGELKRHVSEIHFGIKRHKCNICRKGFKRKDGLVNHEKYAHEKMLINCDICERSFSTILSLKMHVKLYHSVTKNTKCKICDKSFENDHNLSYQHMLEGFTRKIKIIIVTLVIILLTR